MVPVLDRKALNESPSEKEGKCRYISSAKALVASLNESPSEKEGKCRYISSAKALVASLNESPSEKEGKWRITPLWILYRMSPQ